MFCSCYSWAVANGLRRCSIVHDKRSRPVLPTLCRLARSEIVFERKTSEFRSKAVLRRYLVIFWLFLTNFIHYWAIVSRWCTLMSQNEPRTRFESLLILKCHFDRIFAKSERKISRKWSKFRIFFRLERFSVCIMGMLTSYSERFWKFEVMSEISLPQKRDINGIDSLGIQGRIARWESR